MTHDDQASKVFEWMKNMLATIEGKNQQTSL